MRLGRARPTARATTLDDAAAFNLSGMIGDLPSGEMGALQLRAALLGKADRELTKARSEVALRITNLKLSSSPVAGGMLVKVSGLDFQATVEGITIGYKGGCLTYSYLGRSVRHCPNPAMTRAADNEDHPVLHEVPARVATRLTKNPPTFGIVTVQENGRWFVSPVATMFDALNGSLSILQPQDLEAIASLAEDPAELHALGTSLEKVALGALASGSATF